MSSTEKPWYSRLSKNTKIALFVIALILVSVITVQARGTPTPQTKAIKPTTQHTNEQPKITVKTERQTVEIPFGTTTVKDSDLPKGQTKVVQSGSYGQKTLIYKVKYEDNTEIGRDKVSEIISVPPTNKVVAIGTYVAPSRPSNCDPNYSGCVPIASDVDCAGGSGNGPAYTGPVRVIGYDIYGLDRDNDGYACE